MKTQVIEKIVKPFDYKVYCTEPNYRLFTQNGNPVTISYSCKLDKNSNKISYVGLVEFDDNFVVNVWNSDGEDANHNQRYNIRMEKEVKPNYDHITSEDVPDTEEFKKQYDEFCKYSFKMSEVEYLRYKEFCKDHRECVRNTGTIGGGISVSFMGTGLGNIVKAKCDICGLEVDLTDSSCW